MTEMCDLAFIEKQIILVFMQANRFSLHCLFEHAVAFRHFTVCSVFSVHICHQSSFPL